MTRKKYITISVAIILISIIVLIGTSYALLTMTIEGDKKISVTAGILKVDFTDGNYINLDNAAPVTDKQGLKTSPYTFTITNTGNINAYYHVSLEEETTNTLTHNYLKMRLTNDKGYDSGVVYVSDYEASEMEIMSEQTLEPGEDNKVTYQLWMWLDYNADNSAQGKEYKSKIVVTSYDRKMGSNAVALVKSKSNEESLDYATATESQQKEAWVHTHPATEQTEALTDYRYIGADPNNYVEFNDELWRIIGVFTVDDGTGKVEERLKIIRNESIGIYSWDNKNTETGAESAYGKNNWTDARLNYLLNPGHESESVGGSLYWNSGSGTCYNGQNNATTNCDFTSTGLKEEARNMIGDTLWYLGGTLSYTSASNGLASHWYSYERGTTVYNSSTSPSDTSFVGKVGLMYPSDYGYATSGGSTKERNACLNKELYNWGSSEFSDCKNNDWLYESSYAQWTLSPRASYSDSVFYVSSSGFVYYTGSAYSSNGVRPVAFLKSNIKIVDGDGSSSNPYILKG